MSLWGDVLGTPNHERPWVGQGHAGEIISQWPGNQHEGAEGCGWGMGSLATYAWTVFPVT